MDISERGADCVDYYFWFDSGLLLEELHDGLNFDEAFALLNGARCRLCQAKAEIDSAIEEVVRLAREYEGMSMRR